MSRRLRASLQAGSDHVTFKRSFVVQYFNCHKYHHVGAVCVKCTVYTLQLSDFFADTDFSPHSFPCVAEF